MLIGAISDTHDNLDQVKKAVEAFRIRNVEAIVHCGDFITPVVFDVLSQLSVGFFGVFGNNDYKEALRSRSRDQIKEEPHRIEIGGRKIFVCHHRRFLEQTSAANSDFDVALYGETHEAEIRKQGKLLIINPGEACGWVTGFSTVAFVDLEKLSAEIVRLEL